MNFRSAAEIIALVGIIVSLIFVAFEIRQNTYVARSTIIQMVTEQSIGALQLMVESNELRDALHAVEDGSATRDQGRQAELFFALLIRGQQNRYMQAGLGIVSLDEILNLGGRAPIYKSAAFTRWWRKSSQSYGAKFRRHVETRLIADNAAP